jgi:hypothetical protein
VQHFAARKPGLIEPEELRDSGERFSNASSVQLGGAHMQERNEAHMQERKGFEQSRPSAELLTTTRVRAGVTGHNVRYVLGISLTAAVILVALAGFLVSQGWL